MKVFFVFFANELRLYRAQHGLALALILTLTLSAVFRFGMPAEGANTKLLEVIPVTAYLIANLQLLLGSVSWESDAYAYRYYLMNGTPLEALFFAKSAAAFIVQLPLWIFSIAVFFLFFPVELPPTAVILSLLLTCLPLGAALSPAGQLVAAIAQHSTQKNFLAIALFLPLCLPVVIAAAGRVSALINGLETLRYDALLVAAALVFLGAGNLLFAYLFEE